MIIKIANLSLGEHYFDFLEKVEDIQLNEPFIGKISTKVSLNKLSDQIIADVNSKLLAEFECDRCTCKFESTITSNYKMVYLMKNNESESDDINVTFINRDADKISLDNDVREFAILAIPMKKLCKEDCKGLCPRCGVDLNFEKCNCQKEEINPVWLPLIENKDKLNNKKRNR
jgi:uncharacterized protein